MILFDVGVDLLAIGDAPVRLFDVDNKVGLVLGSVAVARLDEDTMIERLRAKEGGRDVERGRPMFTWDVASGCGRGVLFTCVPEELLEVPRTARTLEGVWRWRGPYLVACREGTQVQKGWRRPPSSSTVPRHCVGEIGRQGRKKFS